ncbi:tRNA preQ1(34) S-adenosylmethionine ribosyltransferase-isomerase QueA [Candidatus Saccharibacteria bacterium]|nr:tRNA preQ1(34) S-adenosylmethionine ribosyltransferase-isomerase QueA [Candidatus Saccharibacteria bacterium]
MLVSDYNYNLPEENIAKHPPKVRGTTRLLVLDRNTGNITDSRYADLADFLESGDLIILNDTRVMRARVFAELPGGYKRELVVLEKHKDDLNSVMYHGKLRAGDVLTVLTTRDGEKTIDTVTIREILGNGTATVSSSRPLADIVEQYGTVPLPPYLRRDADPDDIKRYQTVWAKELGSAAAPTASLNMTEELINKLKTKGVNIEYLTLHVGLGTFLPIRSDKVEEHHMHSEWFHIPEQTIKAIEKTKKANHKVIAVGTTVTRTLEFWAKSGKTEGEDDIFIYPGFKFQVVDALLTNFHAPKSTVLMLASAFAGWDRLKPAYDHAVESGYQLLSYGDSMLIR